MELLLRIQAILIVFWQNTKNLLTEYVGIFDIVMKFIFLCLGFFAGTAYLSKTTSIMQLIGYFSLAIWVQAIVLLILVIMAVITGNYK
jgi:hypothetical protein